MNKPVYFLALLLISAFTLTSCTNDGCTDPAAANYDSKADKDDGTCIYNQLPSLNLAIDHMVDGTPLQKDTIIYTNAAGNEYSISKLRYYISDLTLYTTDGDSIFIPYYKHIDAFGSATGSATLPYDLPIGNYNAIRLNFGLTPRLNHLDSMPNTEPHTSFTWPQMMGGGYHYMQLEGSYRFSPTETRFYNTHVGRLKTSTADVDPNFSVKLPFQQTIQSVESLTKNGYLIVIEADLNEWYENPNIYNFTDYSSGVMGNPQAQQALSENGRSVFSVKHIAVSVE